MHGRVSGAYHYLCHDDHRGRRCDPHFVHALSELAVVTGQSMPSTSHRRQEFELFLTRAVLNTQLCLSSCEEAFTGEMDDPLFKVLGSDAFLRLAMQGVPVFTTWR